jgi:twitching motility protein PilT
MASLINSINRERAEKIITIENPIEHIFTADKSIVDQREVGRDTNSFSEAIYSALRQDANVIAIGDLNSVEDIEAALSASEAGRLVYAVTHSGSAVETLERMIFKFPADRQEEIRNRFAGAIAGTVSQRLVPHLKGGLIPVVEVMVATTAVRTHIRDNHLRQIDQAIETGYDMGMMSLDRSLADRVRRKEISLENAESYSNNPSSLRTLIV